MRVLLIGLDGATYDVLLPLMEAGLIPHLKRLFEQSAHGTLRSTMLPITAPAWAAMATGLNPGKLGVFDFWNRTGADGFEFAPVTSRVLRGRTCWDAVGDAGGRVLVFNYPVLYPVYPLNGIGVSGTGAPTGPRCVYPEDLWRTFDAAGYQTSIAPRSPVYERAPRKLGRDLLRFLGVHEGLVLECLEADDWDLSCIVISVSDWAQHYYWRYLDPDFPLPDGERQEGQIIFRRIWQRIDEFVGRILTRAGPETYLFVVSDHGFGPERQCFYVNDWLVRQGYLHLKPERERGVLGRFGEIRRWGRLAGRHVPGLFGRLQRLLQRQIRFASVLNAVDLERSRAVSLGSMAGGFIYCLEDAARAQIVEDLRAIRTLDGLPVTLEVFPREEIYTGDQLDRAPDIVLLANHGEAAVIDRLSGDGRVFADEPWTPGRSGNHRREGIVFVTGPGVHAGELPVLDILDIAPSILHLFGLKGYVEMDGHVMEVLMDASPDDLQIGPQSRQEKRATPELDARETQEIEKQLRDLGYL